MISSGPVDGDQVIALIRDRLEKAIALRRSLVHDSDACRLVFSEADQLPGIVVDRYNDVLTAQFLTQATDQEQIRQLVIDALVGEVRPASIIERVDERIRELEELPPRETQAVFGEKTSTVFSDEWSSLSLRRNERPEDWRVSRPARELRCRGPLCSWRSTRCLYLSGRIRASSRKSMQQCNRGGQLASRAGNG